ncbi:tRNA threonylcarbamoyladenosine biosynthesis protein [Mycoavidus cysteinexigens]|uniref:Threonylcarbamoyl-AMP synthase n=1 Tax=Mycoavidus cysteinexigens TaxID=1553431 RepID=A0A2Z6EXE7_9BURK|nr:tRNA threonylcarbamoyladenosine biosynthesis protein [Mycoavidus cysteinexigens]GAM53532.1 TsaC protein (YrdC domain) required for threonylcarbamoyladenosine t(6)A37 modification in tRNA [bacterium endosymbiont of Mortierella elongata FMR23-6]GLR00537.1 threonylcarbamoyl-AMP synthase [Mycoavidus cysteinexigens]
MHDNFLPKLTLPDSGCCPPTALPVDESGIAHAAHLLERGELLAFPTETVYGLGADAENPAAIARIYAAKGRPLNHPVIVHLAPDADLAYWVSGALPLSARALIDAFWPGPLTLILSRAAHIPDAVSGGQSSIGLRCPAHPVAQALLSAFRGPGGKRKRGQGGVAAPSANRFGRVSPTRAQHVYDEFGVTVPVLDGGACAVGIESTILDLSRGFPALLRPGGISAEQLAEVLGEMPQLPMQLNAVHAKEGKEALHAKSGESAPRVSGTLRAHYAPRIPLALFTADEIMHALRMRTQDQPVVVIARARLAERCAMQWAQCAKVRIIAAAEEPHAYAHELYSLLRTLENTDAERILIEQLPAEPEWAALNDRLGRAAAAFNLSES